MSADVRGRKTLPRAGVYPFVFILPSGDNSFMRGLEAQVRSAMARSAAEAHGYFHRPASPAFNAQALVTALDEGACGLTGGRWPWWRSISTDVVGRRPIGLCTDHIPVVTLVFRSCRFPSVIILPVSDKHCGRPPRPQV